jgi:beta-glucosidase
VIYVGGLSPEWESEGFDRPDLDLPGRQNELISRLGKANHNTLVCIQAVSSEYLVHPYFSVIVVQGSAVAMPWVHNVNAVIYAWYSGNEAGNALSDIIYGRVNPSGRLPLTFPNRLEDIPAFPNLRCENGKIHYREDVFVGYKHYQYKDIKPLFPFG